MVFSACPIFTVCSDWVATMFGGWAAAVSAMQVSFLISNLFVPVHDLHILFRTTVVVALKFHLPRRRKVLKKNDCCSKYSVSFLSFFSHLDRSLAVELAGEYVEEVGM